MTRAERECFTWGRSAIQRPLGTAYSNSSYFLGLFGDSVVALGAMEASLEHYSFHTPEVLMDTIRRHVERALRERGILKLE